MDRTITALLNKAPRIGASPDILQARAAAAELKTDLLATLGQYGVLKPFTRRPHREQGEQITLRRGLPTPDLEVVYEIIFGERYSTELVFSLRNKKLHCQVQTWFHPDGNNPQTEDDCQIAGNGLLTHRIESDSFDQLVQQAVVKAIEHRAELLSLELGITLTATSRKSLLTHRITYLTL